MKWLLVVAVLAGAFFFAYSGTSTDIYACQDDTDCTVRAEKDCCGFTTQTCFSNTASDHTIQFVMQKHCAIKKMDCTTKPAPAAYCKCNTESRKCETVRQTP